MLDFSWAELLVVCVLLVFLIGPKELPVVMRVLGRLIRRLQYLRFAASRHLEAFLEEQDLKELQGGTSSSSSQKEEARKDE